MSFSNGNPFFVAIGPVSRGFQGQYASRSQLDSVPSDGEIARAVELILPGVRHLCYTARPAGFAGTSRFPLAVEDATVSARALSRVSSLGRWLFLHPYAVAGGILFVILSRRFLASNDSEWEYVYVQAAYQLRGGF